MPTHSSAYRRAAAGRPSLPAGRRCGRFRPRHRRRCRARPCGHSFSASRATSSFAFDVIRMRDWLLVEDVGEFARGQVRVHAGVIEARALAGAAGFEIAAVVLHEDRIVVEPLQAAVAKQMRQPVAARLQFAIGDGLAGAGHDEGGLQRTKLSMLAGVHVGSSLLTRPSPEFRAPAPVPRSCAGCAAPRACAIACCAMRSKCSGPTLTSCRLRGMPRPRMKASSTSPASSPGAPSRPPPAPAARHWRICSSASPTAASRRRCSRAARRTRRRARSRCRGWRPSARRIDSGPIESQVPIWQSIRASRSLGIGLHPRQRLRQHRQALQRLGVGIRMRLARADALDAMVDGADAGREPQPFRRVHGRWQGSRITARGITSGWRSASLTLVRLVGDAGDGGELAAGDRGRHADLAHRRRR